MLFCPAINESFLKKAINIDTDSIIFDLEDSVDVNSKKKARENLLNFFPKNYSGSKELIIRINNIKTSFFKEDLKLIKKLKPDTICYPKAESPKEIKIIDKFISSYDNDHRTEIFVLIETANGYFNASSILNSSKRITAFALGSEDLMSELGINRGSLLNNPVLSHVLIDLILLSSSMKLQHIGPIYRGYKTKEQLKELKKECIYLKKMNVRGKLTIHPNQLNIINQTFDITPQEIQEAKTKLKLFQEAERVGSSVISTNNEMEDKPSLTRVKNFLQYVKNHGFDK